MKKSPQDHAKLLWSKASDDLTAARATLATGAALGVVCFLAQQAAEKSLKASLALHGEPYDSSHIMWKLIADVKRVLTNVAFDDSRILALQPFAVQIRYDDVFEPNHADADEALKTAESLHSQIGIVIDTYN
jgi:HEPN domain-containing protein